MGFEKRNGPIAARQTNYLMDVNGVSAEGEKHQVAGGYSCLSG